MRKIIILSILILIFSNTYSQLIGNGNGLKAEYWKGGTNFDKPEDTRFNRGGPIATKVLERIDENIFFLWGNGNPIDDSQTDFPFCSKWKGYVQAQYTGLYTFSLAQWDDGCKIFIMDPATNDTIVKLVDWEPFRWDIETRTVDIEMVAGNYYKIEVQHYENEYGAHAVLQWICWDSEYNFSVVPKSQLYTELPTGVENKLPDNIKLKITNNNLVIEGLQGAEKIQLFNVSGVCISELLSKGTNCEIKNIQKGIYIIRIDGKTKKIII